MKRKSILVFLLLFALILAACQADTPAPEATEAPVESGEEVEAYPPAGQESSTTVQQAAEAPEVLYPDPQDGDLVEWSQAVAMMLNEEVVSIVQSADRTVFLTLKDGRTLRALPSTVGALQEALDECGAICESIEVTIE